MIGHWDKTEEVGHEDKTVVEVILVKVHKRKEEGLTKFYVIQTKVDRELNLNGSFNCTEGHN